MTKNSMICTSAWGVGNNARNFICIGILDNDHVKT